MEMKMAEAQESKDFSSTVEGQLPAGSVPVEKEEEEVEAEVEQEEQEQQELLSERWSPLGANYQH